MPAAIDAADLEPQQQQQKQQLQEQLQLAQLQKHSPELVTRGVQATVEDMPLNQKEQQEIEELQQQKQQLQLEWEQKQQELITAKVT